jgi:hypothetical protein
MKSHIDPQEYLEGLCEEYLEILKSGECNDDAELDNYERNIYEAAMEMVHGDDVWDTICKMFE